MTHVQPPGHIGRRDDNAVAFLPNAGCTLKDLLRFPMGLPLGFSGAGIVLRGEVGDTISHAGWRERNNFCANVLSILPQVFRFFGGRG